MKGKFLLRLLLLLRQANYCSPACQKAHWKESHKAICSLLTGETEAKAKEIIRELERGDTSSLITLQRNNDEVYEMAKKQGLLSTMECLFILEVEGKKRPSGSDEIAYSLTQEIIMNVFKGKREIIERYTCACPSRMKQYILSSGTAWDSMMDAILYLAKELTKEEYQIVNNALDERRVALAHRAARDAFATISLALIHEKVAKAIFYRSKTVGRRAQSEARDYALNTMAPKLKCFFRNGGEGFAPNHVDRNETIQGNVYQFTAMLSYWYRTLDVDPENPDAFAQYMQLDARQEMMFEMVSRPLGEGMIELGRSLTMEEVRERTLKANKDYQQRKKEKAKGGKKGGKKKKRNRR